MSLETEHPGASLIAWSWLKTISRELYAFDETPTLGTSPPFPWEKLSQEFAKVFQLENFQISQGELAWKEHEAVMAGITSPSFCTEITATGIDASVYFWISREDLAHLMGRILQLSTPLAELQEDDLVSSFHHFISIESLYLVNQLDYDKRLSFKIASYAEKRLDAALCQDIIIQVGQEKILARLVISKEFQKKLAHLFLKATGSGTNEAKT